ncbi:DUF4157 domain-containing protein [Streptomyces sp. NPDC087294]|uniref:eCIS core domain-containing protein n=1 Tax=Streptomyces sp. NPDC087294 TaxID=3365777 RepID=UPI00382170F9
MRTSRQRGESAEERQPSGGRAGARREASGTGAAVPPPLTAAALNAVQRSAGNAAATEMIARRVRPTAAPQQADTGVRDVLRSGGKPLPGGVRQEMEARIGADFSSVRLHTGAAAARSARAVGARAYTSGDNVVIGDGGRDKHTLAHELTHVVQQRQGPVSGTDRGDGLKVSDPSDRFERAAEANAHKVMSGPVPDVQRRPEEGAPAPGSTVQRLPESGAESESGSGSGPVSHQHGPGCAHEETVQRASASVLENAVVTHYNPSREGAEPARDLLIERPSRVTGPIAPTGTAGRAAAPNPIAVKKLHAAYKDKMGKRGAPTEAMVWKDLFGGAGFDRGHVMGLEVGGSDVTQNIVPQWSLNQGTGMWRRIEQALTGIATGNLRFEVNYAANQGSYHRVMIPVSIEIYLDNAAYDTWSNAPDTNDLIRVGRDPSDVAEFYTEAKDALNGQTTLTEDQMQNFALAALSEDKATFLAYEDYEESSAQGQTPGAGTSTAAAHKQGMTRSDFPKDRRDKLIKAYIDAGWVTKNGSGAGATYTLDDVPAPAPDSDMSSSSSSESDTDMSSQGSQQLPSPGEPFATIQFGSQDRSSDGDFSDRMSVDSS